MVKMTQLSLLSVLTTKVEEAEQITKAVTPQVGETLRAARHEAGMTVEALAGAAHVSPAYVSMIENGHRTPSATALRSLYSVLAGAEGGSHGNQG